MKCGGPFGFVAEADTGIVEPESDVTKSSALLDLWRLKTIPYDEDFASECN